MSLFRLIARLDIKGANLIKGISFEGLRIIGNPADYALKYANEGADELLYLDTVATLYGRNQLTSILEKTVESVFIPVTACGGVVSIDSMQTLLMSGADKCAINTAALSTPSILTQISCAYGSQAVTCSIEAKRTQKGWEAYTNNGRERTNKDVIQWAHEAEELGAGEILITSIDRDGTQKGPDMDLLRALRARSDFKVPVLYGGGLGSIQDVRAAQPYCDGLAIGAWLHSGKTTINQIKDALGLYRIAA